MPEKETTLAESMVAIFGELENPKFDKANPHFGNKYASLPSIKSVVRPVCSKHGVRYAQDVRLVSDANGCPVFDSAGNPIRALFTEFSNSQGEKELYSWPFIPEKGGPQAAGSAGTYSERQGLCATLGIAGEEDDDGEAAETDRPSSPEKSVAAPPLVDKEKKTISPKQANLVHIWLDKAKLTKEGQEKAKQYYNVTHWIELTKRQMDQLKDDLIKRGDLDFERDDEGREISFNPRDRVKPPVDWQEGAEVTKQIDPDVDNEVIEFLEDGGMP